MDVKTYTMIKRTYGLLKAAYVLMIIFTIIEGIVLLINSNQQNDFSSILSFWPGIVLIAVCYLMLYSKSPYRSKYIAVSVLIYAIWNTAASTVYLFMKNPDGPLYLVIGILFASAGIIIIFVSFLLLQKSRGKSITLRIKPIFILYIVFIYVYLFLTFFALIPTNTPEILTAMIVGAVLGGLLVIIMLQPQFVLFKSLTYEDFYLNFILINPGEAIRMYQDSRKETAARLNENRFCTNCGTPLRPHAAFCTECGSKVNP